MDATITLQLATEAAAFIETQRIDESSWKISTDHDARSDSSLYHGSAGIIVFLLELARATGEEKYRQRAVNAGLALGDRLRAKEWASVAFATGWPGYSFVMQTLAVEAQTADHRNTFHEVAVHCLDRLMAQSHELGDGVGWVEPMPFSDITGKTGDREIYDLSVGAAGAGMQLLHAHRSSLHPSALGWASDVGDRLLEVAEHTDDGLRWGLMSDMPFPFTAPNFAHGGAGVGYFFAHLFEATQSPVYLDAAQRAASYVMSRAVAVADRADGSKAALVCHTEEQQPPLFYLGECHGPAGTWRLLATLARLTGDPNWLSSARRLLDGISALGAPAERSDGWWQNHSQCCGDAGLGDSALAMFGAVGDPAYLLLADGCAAVVGASSQVVGKCRSWEQAEHRARPRFVQSQTGFMQGAAGIGSFLVHLATHESNPSARILFPDEWL